MNFKLRDYQTDVESRIYEAQRENHKFILVVMPMGSGKTVLVSEIIRKHVGAAVIIAHRQELVAQMSLAIARQGVYHNVIAARSTVRFISSQHIKTLGKSFVHPHAPVAVSSVDTLIKRDLGSWRHQVTLWVQDEAHHVLRENKWGKAASLFPNAIGIGVTATPLRADGKGLGAYAHGLFTRMIVGPDMRDLIGRGHLTDYRIFAPLSDVQTDDIPVSQVTGDYSLPKLREAVKKSHLVGDVVKEYIKIANGKLGVTFAVGVTEASEIAEKFRESEVPAEVVSAKTPPDRRAQIIEQFRDRKILNLVNVDLFGEGFDLPAIEVISMARPTESFGLYCQQFGRALRLSQGKETAIVIDHVGNVIRHGLPDIARLWSLDARAPGARKKEKEKPISLTTCISCMGVYERFRKACPHCGHIYEPKTRNSIEEVDGDLYELSPDALSRLRGDIDKKNQSVSDLIAGSHVSGKLKHFVAANQVKRLTAVDNLISAINLWGGKEQRNGLSRAEAHKKFYLEFGTDVLSAQALKTREIKELVKCLNMHTVVE